MFETLTKGFRSAKQRFQGLAELDEATVDEALKDVRTALLEADVGFEVVQDFCQRIKEKAVGVIVKVKASTKEKVRRVTPEDHFVKLCHDELVDLMGPVDSSLKFAKKGPTGIMLVGLQGSGKTTSVGKLARYLEKQHKRPLLVAADVYRPAAIEQLQIIGQQLGIPVYAEPGGKPPEICEKAVRVAAESGRDVILFDTAGRLAIDEVLMARVRIIHAESGETYGAPRVHVELQAEGLPASGSMVWLITSTTVRASQSAAGVDARLPVAPAKKSAAFQTAPRSVLTSA